MSQNSKADQQFKASYPDYNIKVGDLGQSMIVFVSNEIFREYGLPYYAETQDVLVNGVDIRIKLGSEIIMSMEVLNLQDTSYISKQRALRIRRNLRGYSKKAVILSFPENLTRDAKKIFKRSKIPVLSLNFQLLPREIHQSIPDQDLYRRRSPNKRTIKALKNRLTSFFQSIGLIPPVYQYKRSNRRSDSRSNHVSGSRVDPLSNSMIKRMADHLSRPLVERQVEPLALSRFNHVFRLMFDLGLRSLSLGEIKSRSHLISIRLIGGESMPKNLKEKTLGRFYLKGNLKFGYEVDPRCIGDRKTYVHCYNCGRRIYEGETIGIQRIPLLRVYRYYCTDCFKDFWIDLDQRSTLSPSLSPSETPSLTTNISPSLEFNSTLNFEDLVKYCDGGFPELYIEPRCKVCRSRFRRLYDRMYAQGIPLKDIYERALELEDQPFSYHSLRRHLRRHANRPAKLPRYEYKDDTSMILTDDEVFDITLYVIQDLSYERLLELREAINKISNEIDFPYQTIKSLEWLILEALRRSRLENYIPLVKQRFNEYLESHPDLKT